MTAQLVVVLALCLCGFQIGYADELHTCRFKKIEGVINGSFSHRNSTARSRLHCTTSICGCDVRSVCSFNKNTGACLTATLSAAPLTLTKDMLFSSNASKDWVSFAPIESFLPLPTPAGLWLMDSSFRGRNLGSKSPRLDISDAGLAWSSEGPLGSKSNLKYSRFDGQKPHIQVRYNGNYLLDFTKPFSITMWLKTDDRSSVTPIPYGYDSDKKGPAAYLWFYPSTNFDQIRLHVQEVVTSTVNGTNKLMWRHFAAIYNGTQRYALYLNGTVWPFSLGTSGPMLNADLIYINSGPTTSNVLKGSMACLSFFQHALTQEEARAWMQACP